MYYKRPNYISLATSSFKGVSLCVSKTNGIRIDVPDKTYMDYLGICTVAEFEEIEKIYDTVPLRGKIELPNGLIMFTLMNVQLIYNGEGPEMIDIKKFNELADIYNYVFVQYVDDVIFSMHRCRYIYNISDIEICYLTLKDTAMHGLITEDKVSMYIKHESSLYLLNKPSENKAILFDDKLKTKVLSGSEANRQWNLTVSDISGKFRFSYIED